MPKRNIALLTKIRDLIVSQPDKLDMDSWSSVLPNQVGDLHYRDSVKVDCGTTQCIAGWAVQMSGWKFLVTGESFDEFEENGPRYYSTTCVAKNGRTALIEDTAEQLLGLTFKEAQFLFLEVGNDQAVKVLNLFIEGLSLGEIVDILEQSE